MEDVIFRMIFFRLSSRQPVSLLKDLSIDFHTTNRIPEMKMVCIEDATGKYKDTFGELNLNVIEKRFTFAYDP